MRYQGHIQLLDIAWCNICKSNICDEPFLSGEDAIYYHLRCLLDNYVDGLEQIPIQVYLEFNVSITLENITFLDSEWGYWKGGIRRFRCKT